VLAICGARVLLFATFMTVAATIPLLVDAWGLSATAAGALVSSFTVTYAVSLFVSATVADHVGARRVVIVAASAAAVTSLGFGLLARDWGTAVVLYGLVGLAQGGLYTPLIMVFTDEVRPAARGTAMGRLIASTSLGYATSLAVAGIGVALGGWELAFLLSGVLPAIGAVLLLAALRPLPDRVHERPAEAALADDLVRDRETRLLFAGYVGHSWELLGLWAWMPAFLAAAFVLQGIEVAGAATSGAYLSGLLHLFGAVAVLITGRLSDRIGRRPVLVGFAAAGAAASFGIGWLVAAPLALLVPAAIVYTAVCLGDSPVLTTAISEGVRASYRGAVLAWRGLAGFAVGAVSPLAVGATLDLASAGGLDTRVGWGVAFGALGLGGVAALACALALRPGRPGP
jgi:MFS family permease